MVDHQTGKRRQGGADVVEVLPGQEAGASVCARATKAQEGLNPRVMRRVPSLAHRLVRILIA